MKLEMTLIAIVLLIALTACGGSIKPDKIELEELPPSVKQPCAYGVLLPERELTQTESEEYWRADRRSLKVCREKHQIVVDANTAIVKAVEDLE